MPRVGGGLPEAIRFSGRTENMDTTAVTFGWSGAGVRLRFQDSASIGAWLDDDSDENYAMVWIDGAHGENRTCD